MQLNLGNFKAFASSIALQFKSMSRGELYRVRITGDELWEAYLAAFPEGTNPIYRVRTEHDGSYDRNFVKKLGNVVLVNDDGSLTSIWDASGLEYPYSEVATRMSEIVKARPVFSIFRSDERKVGYVSSIERLEDGSTHQWHHFHAEIDNRHYSTTVDATIGQVNTTVQVMRRGLEEITPDAVEIVLDLMESGTLYKGDEFKDQVKKFRTTQTAYRKLESELSRAIFLYTRAFTPEARIRNTVIGTLLTDLSSGVEIEDAVRSYEQKTAPTNYKRPTALITKGMIEQATKTIRELNLESSLERRHARLSDISVNNVLWVDSQKQSAMKDGLTNLLMTEVKPTGSTKNAEQIELQEFLSKVLPKASSMEIYFSNEHQGNLMSLTAPVHQDSNPLFRWNNGFGWSYNGNITDSIREKVKAAGGNVAAKLRVSLAWFNHDDLDLHAYCPDGHVYFGAKQGDKHDYRSGRNGQILDVDMNVSSVTKTPVENLSWIHPRDGQYGISVNQYRRRETTDVGFVLEVENDGKVWQYSYPKAVSATVDALTFTVRNGVVTNIAPRDKGLTGQGIAQQKWNLTTESFVKVVSVLHSPNHWDDQSVGHKHTFFILDGCLNEEPTRGIYNEFLKPELEKHRKVFEVLGNKTKCMPTQDQLSGLGFSSTKRDSVIIRVAGESINKTYQVNM